MSSVDIRSTPITPHFPALCIDYRDPYTTFNMCQGEGPDALPEFTIKHMTKHVLFRSKPCETQRWGTVFPEGVSELREKHRANIKKLGGIVIPVPDSPLRLHPIMHDRMRLADLRQETFGTCGQAALHVAGHLLDDSQRVVPWYDPSQDHHYFWGRNSWLYGDDPPVSPNKRYHIALANRGFSLVFETITNIRDLSALFASTTTSGKGAIVVGVPTEFALGDNDYETDNVRRGCLFTHWFTMVGWAPDKTHKTLVEKLATQPFYDVISRGKGSFPENGNGWALIGGSMAPLGVDCTNIVAVRWGPLANAIIETLGVSPQVPDSLRWRNRPTLDPYTGGFVDNVGILS